MEFFGLPLHPLAVHAAVVLTPIAALLALAYLVPGWRDRLRWPLLVAALVAVASVVVAYLSGSDFRDSERFATATGEFAERLETHEDLGTYLLWWTIAFGVMAVLNTVLHSDRTWVRWLLGVLMAIDALAVLLIVAVTGHSGAEAVWG
ncbi:DUF2231 domain-containing protein [Nocardioides caeni]|uniref:DUF2231 domain-containing protein n=1 Tax=Nocardioides caeni TaxID=574700 RepID=A0A4S8NQE5_9ACTN|nr:DUF2231 domain-containing protein [Nocardioides caeni]THV18372.1 hypothetical protein E9934_01710 [Nocardioides caeni]